jgi:mannosyl-3-phosphoglycerate phosphatase
MTPPFIVFTDLDGCLLDRRTYSAEAARPAVEALVEAGIPLVFCSSQTRAEVEHQRHALENDDPFVVENGGAIFIPRGYFPFPHALTRTEGGYAVVEMGVRYEPLVRLFQDLRRTTGLDLRGFSDMTVAELARHSGLSRDAAARAKARDYDEPFWGNLTPIEEGILIEEARARGLTVSRGGRYFHLTGGHSKGLAAEILIRLYRTRWRPLPVVALGESANDQSMLLLADHPVVVPRDWGVVDPALRHSGWRIAPAPGPFGWKLEVLRVLGHELHAIA